MTKPNFFIVGAPRSGTTSMYHYLKAHPEIFMSVEKEPGYFADDDFETYKVFNTEESYLKLFDSARTHKIVGEASTTYLSSKLAAKRISEFNPDSKILIMLRKPVEFMYALHFERLHRNFTSRTFLQELEVQSKGESSVDYLRLVYDWPSAIKRFIGQFGEQNIKVVIFEEFVKDPPFLYREVLKFLKVEDNNFKPSFDIYNQNKSAQQGMLSMLVKSGLYNEIKKAKKILYSNPALYNAISKFVAPKFEKRPEMDSDLRKKLTKKFKPTVKEIEKIMHDKISSWNE